MKKGKKIDDESNSKINKITKKIRAKFNDDFKFRLNSKIMNKFKNNSKDIFKLRNVKKQLKSKDIFKLRNITIYLKNFILKIFNKIDDLTKINVNNKQKEDKKSNNKDLEMNKNINKNKERTKDYNNISNQKKDKFVESKDNKIDERFLRHVNINNDYNDINNDYNDKNGLNDHDLNKEEKKHAKYLKEFKNREKFFEYETSNEKIYSNENKNSNEKRYSNEKKYNSSSDLVQNKKEKKQFNLKDIIKLDKNSVKDFKKTFLSKDDDETKTMVGGAIFGLIIIVLLFSSYYFLIYSPSQDALAAAKTSKLNELNSLFKGPLALDNDAFVIKSQIESANSPEEAKSIDILRPATAKWREYHNRIINNAHDDFNRVMAVYEATSNKKNVIMDVEDAHSFVDENDGTSLANLEFKKPDTVAVPILISRLQAGAGLLTVGSIVDIYSLNSESNQISDSKSNDQSTDQNDSQSGSSESSDQEVSNDDSNSNSSYISSPTSSDDKKISNSPIISGATILAIMRSKDSGVIDANYIKTHITTNGDQINQIEDSKSFSTNVEEMLRGAITGGFNEKEIADLLNSYGLTLSNYERSSNIAEIDVQYLILVEVPREDVSFVINDMDNLILTIPTSYAPTWMVNELQDTYNK
ncbi:hypothetical protein MBCUT_14940 [Methanobrevibacter cuticularis]|uniref:Flp pilus assembly protein RcpC/CpaB domain-containing protein n=1 Tax=Methanobrevibacter cuticularis TaxID=47311 RepID=A0A166CMM7_9EURY|nr:DUF515 domain-containing protein [Methanobrevibacter cuticularis]KZX15497.1 hypothetical protein MBCUT_14940 [Methanobrevibacter cuticularis]